MSSQTSKWIIDKNSFIITYLNNIINKHIESNKTKITLTQQNLMYTKQVLTLIASKRCANILIYFSLGLVSRNISDVWLI